MPEITHAPSAAHLEVYLREFHRGMVELATGKDGDVDWDTAAGGAAVAIETIAFDMLGLELSWEKEAM